jgi:uncharacterized protein (DUF58 family)
VPKLALDPADIARLGSMSVRARVIVEGALAGMHQNPHAGASIEFSEHKEYAPGDDIRRIDWKAVGRVDRYYIKRFEDETEMRTFLLVDASASMGYGRATRRREPRNLSGGSDDPVVTKLDYASYLAAALAYLLAQQGDPAGLLLFDEKTRQYLPPRARGGQIRDLLATLEAAYPAGKTEPGRALGYIGEIAERRSLVVLFTDLLDAPADLPDRLRQLRSRGNDVVLFQLLDPDEIDLPFDELTHFEGLEPDDGRRLLVDPRDLRASFHRESEALRARWRQICVEARVEYRFASTAEPPAEVLRAFLAGRQRVRR